MTRRFVLSPIRKSVERTLLTRAILGELQAAIADCNRALQSEPTDAAAYDLAWVDLYEDGSFDTLSRL